MKQNKTLTAALILLATMLYGLSFWSASEKKETPGGASHFPGPFETDEPLVDRAKGTADTISKEKKFKEEFITPPSGMQVHVASMTEQADGTLAAVWYGGTHEGSKDTFIYFSTRPPGERRGWSEPRGIVGRESASAELNRYIKKIGNPLIFCRPGERLWLMFVTVSIGGWSGSSINVKTSADGGQTWTPARRLTLSPFLNVSQLVRNNPIPLRGGGFVVPIYHECIGTFSELLWLRPGPDGGPGEYYKTRLTWGKLLIQPAMAVLSPFRAAVYYRSHRGEPQVAFSFINRYGEAEQLPQYIQLPNPDAGINVLALPGKRLLLAYNHHEKTRENLSLALSDDGISWNRRVVLENTPGKSFSYPYMILDVNGHIHLVYTWNREGIKHLTFNETWLESKLEDWRREAAK